MSRGWNVRGSRVTLGVEEGERGMGNGSGRGNGSGKVMDACTPGEDMMFL